MEENTMKKAMLIATMLAFSMLTMRASTSTNEVEASVPKQFSVK